MAKQDRRQQATGLFQEAVASLGGEAPVVAPTPAEKSASVRGRRTMKWNRNEMELWELDPRKSRTRQQILDMAASMKQSGQDIPIIARYHPDPEKRAHNIIQILAGGTRWEASAPDLADIPLLDVDLRDVPDDREAHHLAWRTNSQSNPHSAVDNALYFKQELQFEGIADPGTEPTESDAIVKREATLRKVGAEHGIGKDRVAQFINILKLPPKTLAVFLPPKEGQEPGEDEQRVEWNEKHARALLKLTPYEDEQNQLFMEIKQGKLSGNAAVARADVLESHARQDAGLPPKLKKTRKPKVHPVSSTPAGSGPTPPVVVPSVVPPPTPTHGGGADGTAQVAIEPSSSPPAEGSPAEEQPAPPTAVLQIASSESLTAEEKFEPAVILIEQLAASLDNQPLSVADARQVGFLEARLRRGVEKISTHIDIIKGVKQ